MLDAIKKWAWDYRHDTKFLSGEKCQTYSRLKNDQPELAVVMQITQHRKNTFSLSFKIPKSLKEHAALCQLMSPFLSQNYNHSRKSLERWTYFASERVSFSRLCSKISVVQEQLCIQGDPLREMLSDLVLNHLESMDLIDVDYDGPVVYLDTVESVFKKPFSDLKVNFSFRNMNELLSPRGIQVQQNSPTKKQSSSDLSFDEQIEARRVLYSFDGYRHRSGSLSAESEQEFKTPYADSDDMTCGSRCSIM